MVALLAVVLGLKRELAIRMFEQLRVPPAGSMELNRTVKELRNGRFKRKQQLLQVLREDWSGLVEAFLKRGYRVVANRETLAKEIHSRCPRILHWSMDTSGDPRTAAKIVDLPYRDWPDRCAD